MPNQLSAASPVNKTSHSDFIQEISIKNNANVQSDQKKYKQLCSLKKKISELLDRMNFQNGNFQSAIHNLGITTFKSLDKSSMNILLNDCSTSESKLMMIANQLHAIQKEMYQVERQRSNFSANSNQWLVSQVQNFSIIKRETKTCGASRKCSGDKGKMSKVGLSKEEKIFKKQIETEIKMREKKEKLQSQSHLQNKKKVLQKQIDKAKQMNKRVQVISQQNAKGQRQKLQQFKIHTIFQPQKEAKCKTQKSDTFNQGHRPIFQTQIEDLSTRPMSKNVSFGVELRNGDFPLNPSTKKVSLKDTCNKSQKYILKCSTTNKLPSEGLLKKSNTSKLINASNSQTCKSSFQTSFVMEPEKKTEEQIFRAFCQKNNNLRTQQAMNRRQILDKENQLKMLCMLVQKQEKLQKVAKQRRSHKSNKNCSSASKQNQGAQKNDKNLFHRLGFQAKTISNFKTRRKLDVSISNDIQKKGQNREKHLNQRVNLLREQFSRQRLRMQRHSQRQYESWVKNEQIQAAAQNFSLKGSPSKKSPKAHLESKQKTQQLMIRRKLMKNDQKQTDLVKCHQLSNLSTQDLQRKWDALNEKQLQGMLDMSSETTFF